MARDHDRTDVSEPSPEPSLDELNRLGNHVDFDFDVDFDFEAAGGAPDDSAAQPARAATRAALHSGAVVAQYELIRKLGRGGMAEVYLARDTWLGRRVAIKFLAHEGELLAQRFLAEARATAQCRHDNIVDIYDVGEAFGHSYMVLEYLEGMTLRAWLSERWQSARTELDHADSAPEATSLSSGMPVSPLLAIELIVPVVRALEHAHALGMVHRDLKPENIMLTENGSIKVVDFGIAKVLGEQPPSRGTTPVSLDRDFMRLWSVRGYETAAGDVLGTMPYMSPEHWGVDEIDARSDLWAVGIMLWELLTGRHPLETPLSTQLLSVKELNQPMPLMSQQRPDLGPIGAIIDRCLHKRKADRVPSATALLAELEPLMPGRGFRVMADSAEPESPFTGLAAFQEADAARFFGRDCDIASMVNHLRNHCMVTVAGASGAGKSSFVRAGVIPALKRSGQNWDAFVLRPGRRPLAGLAGVLAQVAPTITANGADSAATADGSTSDPDAREAVIGTLRTQPGYLGAALRARCHQRHTRIVLFVDQFEELYTLGTAAQTRAAFIACLEGVADDASSPLRVVLSLRSDFLDRLAEDRAFTGELTRGMVLLPSLGRAQLRQALIRPVEAAGYSFEAEDMVDTMLDTLESTRSPLPLLQFTAAKLWDMRDREKNVVTVQSYRELGGIAGALASHADAVLTGLSAREQPLARLVFTNLVTEERTRAIVSVDELRAMCPDSAGDTIANVLHHLADARLVIIETDTGKGGSTVELSHESLIDRWPRLGQWLDEDHGAAQFRARLRAAAREWDRQGRSEDLLWRGRAADDARRCLEHEGRTAGHRNRAPATYGRRLWRATRGRVVDRKSRHAMQGDLVEERSGRAIGDSIDSIDSVTGLSERDQLYLQAVADLATRARQRRQRIAAAGIATLIAVAILVSCLAVRANREAMRAEEQVAETAKQAERARREAARAQRQTTRARDAVRIVSARELQDDPTSALALLREVENDRVHGWIGQVSLAAQSPIARAVLIGHEGMIASARFSPDSKRVLTASADRTARLWRADGTGAAVIFAGHSNRLQSAIFSPDGSHIATASDDHTVRIWHIASTLGRTPRQAMQSGVHIERRANRTVEPVVLRGHAGAIVSLHYSPDGERLVSASGDKTARVWRADGSGEAIVLSGHTAVVRTAVFSSDGKRVLTASADGTARIWNADGSGTPIVLTGHRGPLWGAEFSPDGTRVLTASDDATARLWRSDGTGRPVVLVGHSKRVNRALFSPDGNWVLTASDDHTARLWRADGTGQPVILSGHEAPVWWAVFSPDGRLMATASMDKTVRVWRLGETGVSGGSVVLSGHTGSVWRLHFSPDGRYLLSIAWDRTVRVWPVYDLDSHIALNGHATTVWRATFSPDGKWVASASWDGTARLWNADGSGQARVLRDHSDAVTGVEFSPDGTHLATISRDGTARVFDLQSATSIELRGHTAAVKTVAFHPDGELLATASEDKTARIWRIDGRGEPIVLSGHSEQVHWVSFSPDGEHVVTTSSDRTARIWRTDGSGESVVLAGHSDWTWVAEFSPDSERVATASSDKTVRVWRTDGRGEPVVLAGHTDTVWWLAFSPDGTRLATASADKTARVWPADGTGEPVVLHGHSARTWHVAFSPDGRRVVTASADKTARVWNADGSGVAIVLQGHTDRVWTAKFDRDGRRVVTGSADGTVRIWPDVSEVPSIESLRGRLWRDTTYCIPVSSRQELLGQDEQTATADYQRCKSRVAQAIHSKR
ncbi:MAG: protein kinase [Proteobacteria bacterium]|nr:protein kinase [Pseudomonadota bacterium]